MPLLQTATAEQEKQPELLQTLLYYTSITEQPLSYTLNYHISLSIVENNAENGRAAVYSLHTSMFFSSPGEGQ